MNAPHLILEQLSNKQQELWDAGLDASIEELIANESSLEVSECVLDLIYREVCHRECLDELVVVDEYIQRFPRLSDRIQRIFEIHEALLCEVSHTSPLFPMAQSRLNDKSLAGERVGDLLIGEELGRGGVAVVYESHDFQLERKLAVKTIKRHFTNTSDPTQDGRSVNSLAVAKSLITREASIMASLSHPGIPPVHSKGELSNGDPFFAMKLIEGKTLEQLIDQGLDSTEALQIFERVTLILASAHEADVIHRDLKPANIMVGRYGEVQVVDWGMAKQLRNLEPLSAQEKDDLQVVETNNSTSVCAHGQGTVAGEILGTLAYMSPEQAKGEIAGHDQRTDVFALGAILCRILTGHPPYRARHALSLWIQAQSVDLTDALPALKTCGADQQLISLTIDCLAEDAGNRPENAGIVADRMLEYFESQRQRIQTAEIDRVAKDSRIKMEVAKRRLAVIVAAGSIMTLVVAVAFAIIFVLQQRNSDLAQTRVQLDALYHAPPSAVPYAIEGLRPFRTYALPELLMTVKKSKERRHTLHAAFALADFEGIDPTIIANLIAWAEGENCQNFVTAFGKLKDKGKHFLLNAAREAKKARDLKLLSRIALLLLHLGDDSIACEVSSPEAEAAEVTMLTLEASSWHGDLSGLAKALAATKHEHVKAAIVAGVSLKKLNADEKAHENWDSLLHSMHARSQQADSRSAALHALRKLGRTLPKIGKTPKHANWTISQSGLYLVSVPVGEFSRPVIPPSADEHDDVEKTQRVRISIPYRLSSEEINVKLYREFTEATGREAGRRNTPDRNHHPATGVTFDNAVFFCNWLSKREGLEPVYEHDGTRWIRTVSIGYRLPSAAEWELACRAGSKCKYSYGNDTALLKIFAVSGAASTNECGGRLPNRLGLFDMHGNAWEWCFDYWANSHLVIEDKESAATNQPVVDDIVILNPKGPDGAAGRVVKGGSYRVGRDRLEASDWSMSYEEFEAEDIGFRVAIDNRAVLPDSVPAAEFILRHWTLPPTLSGVPNQN